MSEHKHHMKHKEVRALLKKNEFEEMVYSAGEYTKKNSETIIIAAIAAIVIMVATPIFLNSRAANEVKGEQAVSRAAMMITRPVVNQENAGMYGLFRTENEKMDAVINAYNDVLQNFKGTKAEPLAYLGIANANLSWGKLKEAQEYYNTFIEKYPKHPLYADGLSGRAYVNYQLSNYKEAAADWELAAKTGVGSYLINDINLRLADAYVKLGRKDEAKAKFEEVVKNSPDSMWSAEAAERLLKLN